MKTQWADLPMFRLELENQGKLADSTIYSYIKSIDHFLKDNPDLSNINDYNDLYKQDRFCGK